MKGVVQQMREPSTVVLDGKFTKDDLKYISVSSVLARIKELENRNYDTMSADGIYNFNRDSAIINELKQLIENK